MSWPILTFFLYNSDSAMSEDEMLVGDELSHITLNRDLEQQIFNALDPRFLLQLVRKIFLSCLWSDTIISFCLDNMLSLSLSLSLLFLYYAD